MKVPLSLVALCLYSLFFSQSITIQSQKKVPIEGILVMNSAGEFSGITDENGIISLTNLSKERYFLLNHPSVLSDTLFTQKIINDTYEVEVAQFESLEDVTFKLEEKDYLVLEGYFNAYVTNSGLFNVFVDGKVQYIFDRKTFKYKSRNILEYRSFILENENQDAKRVASVVFDSFMELPNLKIVQKLDNGEQLEKTFVENNNETNFVLDKSVLSDSEMKFFGYVFKNISTKESLKIDGTETKPTRIKEYSNHVTVDLKHKTEDSFSTIISNANFYPTSFTFLNKKELPDDVKFNRNASNYASQYWKEEKFASFYHFLVKQFQDKLVEQPNKNK